MFLGNAPISKKDKNKSGFPTLLRKQNTWLCFMFDRKLYGFNNYYLNLIVLNKTPLLFMLTTLVQSELLNLFYHEQTKHIKINCHHIREAYDDKTITLPHVSTNIQNADIYTKTLPRNRHEFFKNKSLLIDSPATI